MIVLSIDIGSTWTKGAAFTLTNDGKLGLLTRESRPTSVANLSENFFAVVDALEGVVGPADELHYSSSAKGGLCVAALGMVPEITSEMARIAAYSAGARLSQVYSYRLTQSDIAELENSPPDILLFAGGTDGGHTDCVLHNAQRISASSLTCPVVYAGNRAIHEEVAALLSGHDVTFVDNLLPSLERPNPEPARAAMRSLFLSHIASGKGLDLIVDKTGVEPTPTPYAIYEYCHHIRTHVPGWEDFMLIDLGGATTDVYSSHQERPTRGTVQRGLSEPVVKRTVEGDLGMRVSAKAATFSGRDLIETALKRAHQTSDDFAHHIDKVSQYPETLPQDTAGQTFDACLAGSCFAGACIRHAGRIHQVSTTDGLINVQRGRDLSGVQRIVGSGGYLARNKNFDPNPWLADIALDEYDHQILTPKQVQFYRDEHYLFPLLANIARAYPEAAARAGIAQLHTPYKAAA